MADAEWAIVRKHLQNRLILVETEADRAEVEVHLSGAMRVGVVRLAVGERVRIQRSRFDPSKGRVVGRS